MSLGRGNGVRPRVKVVKHTCGLGASSVVHTAESSALAEPWCGTLNTCAATIGRVVDFTMARQPRKGSGLASRSDPSRTQTVPTTIQTTTAASFGVGAMIFGTGPICGSNWANAASAKEIEPAEGLKAKTSEWGFDDVAGDCHRRWSARVHSGPVAPGLTRTGERSSRILNSSENSNAPGHLVIARLLPAANW